MENRLDGKRGKGLYRRREDYALYDDSSVRFEITVLNACKTSGAEASGGKASGGETSGTVRLAVLERGVEIGQAEITVRQEKEIKKVISQEIKLDGFKPWTLRYAPISIDVIIRYGEDEVRSYFGMRKPIYRPGRERHSEIFPE